MFTDSSNLHTCVIVALAHCLTFLTERKYRRSSSSLMSSALCISTMKLVPDHRDYDKVG